MTDARSFVAALPGDHEMGVELRSDGVPVIRVIKSSILNSWWVTLFIGKARVGVAFTRTFSYDANEIALLYKEMEVACISELSQLELSVYKRVNE